jgi:PAS domain S-box-containing protein
VPRAPSASAEIAHPAGLFQVLVENLTDILTIVDGLGRIEYDSPAVLPILGYVPGELVGRNAFELIHPDDAGAALDLLIRTVSTPGATASIVMRFRHRDGSWRVLESSGRTLPDFRVLVTSRDATERLRARGRRLARAQVEMLERLTRAAECRDDDTGQHTRRVGELAQSLAREVGLPAASARLLRRAAPLHDVGKIGIRDSILLKPGPLTDDELEVMRGHTLLGARLLARGRSGMVRAAEQVALSHHESWDGSGYPRGIAGETIPLSARIVALADFYDALTHDRPYRPALPRPEVVRMVREERGRRFDPIVVDAFMRLDERSESITESRSQRSRDLQARHESPEAHPPSPVR